MIRAVKQIIKLLPFPLFLRVFYLFYFSSRLPQLSRAAHRYKLGQFSEVDLNKLKKSDTLFILGNGPSINMISQERWRVIGSGDTIATNFWIYHRFVPSMYFFELIDPVASEAVCREFVRVANANGSRYRPVIKVVTELHRERLPMLDSLSSDWRENTFTFRPLPVAARNEDEFTYALRYLKCKGAFEAAKGNQYLFKYCSTLTALIALGVRIQYKRIVLCGMDLRTSGYFYDDRQLYPDVLLERQTGTGAFYTLTEIPWLVKIDAVLRVMRKEVLEPSGIQLYVENRSSALWPEIPEAPAELFAENGHTLAC